MYQAAWNCLEMKTRPLTRLKPDAVPGLMDLDGMTLEALQGEGPLVPGLMVTTTDLAGNLAFERDEEQDLRERGASYGAHGGHWQDKALVASRCQARGLCPNHETRANPSTLNSPLMASNDGQEMESGRLTTQTRH